MFFCRFSSYGTQVFGHIGPQSNSWRYHSSGKFSIGNGDMIGAFGPVYEGKLQRRIAYRLNNYIKNHQLETSWAVVWIFTIGGYFLHRMQCC